MADIINLRSVRKKLKRQEREDIAAQNRAKFGTPKAVRLLVKSNIQSDEKKLDQHFLDSKKDDDE